MPPRVSNIFFIVGCILLALALIYSALQLQPAIYLPLGVTVLTALLGLSATLHTQRETRRREIEAAYRKEKVDAYLSFLKLIENLLAQTKPELGREKMSENDIVDAMMDIRTRAILWGSPGVLKGLYKFPKMQHLKISPLDVLEELQREIRIDLGLSNEGLGKDFFAELPLGNPEDLKNLREELTP